MGRNPRKEELMTDKELRRLSRTELLQLFLEQTKELERTQEKLEQANKEKDELKAALESRRILVHKAGSIAEASLQINQVMETAQKAADQYLENIQAEYSRRANKQYSELLAQLKQLEEATKARCDAMLREAQGKAESDGGNG